MSTEQIEGTEAQKNDHYLSSDTLISDEIKTTMDKLSMLAEKARMAGLTVTFHGLPSDKCFSCSVSRVIKYIPMD
ncbi:MAG: hypothetical protein AB9922_07330 [Bacteroidales bacterium]